MNQIGRGACGGLTQRIERRQPPARAGAENVCEFIKDFSQVVVPSSSLIWAMRGPRVRYCDDSNEMGGSASGVADVGEIDSDLVGADWTSGADLAAGVAGEDLPGVDAPDFFAALRTCFMSSTSRQKRAIV